MRFLTRWRSGSAIILMPANRAVSNGDLISRFIALGALNAAATDVSRIPFEPNYRKLCESNACGKYNRCWMCPPLIGGIDELIKEAQSFETAIVYQSVGELKDCYDFEGMMAASKRHNELAAAIARETESMPFAKTLHLAAGGCRMCDVCAKENDEPCRSPDSAVSSLEAYGVSVSELASLCNMKYMHGPDTVTYFGAFFYKGKR